MKDIRKKVIIVTLICIFLLIGLILFIIINNDNSEEFNPNLSYDINDMNNLCKVYNIKYLSESEDEEKKFYKKYFLVFPYDTLNSNDSTSKNYYEEVISLIAKVNNYNNVVVFDDEKALKIEIICNKDNKKIDRYIINGKDNYFEELENRINLSKIKKIEIKNIKSNNKIINNLIKNKWNYNSVNFGKKDSVFNDYDIYFDEGIEIRKINEKIFNIVFTEKYKDFVIEDLKTTSTFDEIQNKLGDSFVEKDQGILGYQTKDYYVFFTGKQISIYRVESFDTNEFSKLVDDFLNSRDEKTFIKEIIKIWPDYDFFEQNERENEIHLKYSLKGVEFKINIDKEHGVTLYTNYEGKVTNDISYNDLILKEVQAPKYIHLKNRNLILENELKRVFGYSNYEIMSDQYNYLVQTGGILNDDKKINPGTNSDKFFYIKDESKMYIYSKDNRIAPIEIKDVYYYFWKDNTHLVYSIFNKGIYEIDLLNKNKKTIIEGNDIYRIYSYNDNKIMYDKKEINID